MTQDDPMILRAQREGMAAKSARLLDLSRENDRNGGVSPDGLLARAFGVPVVTPDEPDPEGAEAQRPGGDVGAGRGSAPATGYRAAVRDAEESGDVARAIQLKSLRLREGFDERFFHLYL